MNESVVNLAPFPGFFQVAYVTNDFDRAQALFAETHGAKRFLEMRDMRYQTGPGREAHCHIGLAYVGATEIELIQPLSSDVAIYQDFLPKEGFGLRFHHLCKLFDTDADYDRQIEAYRKRGMQFPIMGEATETARYFYCDFRAELGHYIEGIVFKKEAREWLSSIPRN